MVYYVEDDTNIRELAVYALKQAGIDAEGVADDAQLRLACERKRPEAILLDIMLPQTDGLSILARLRQSPDFADIPIMMLTAKDSELDTVKALDAGADDYLCKPFGMMEMVSRVRALIRRSKRHTKEPVQAEIFELGELKLSKTARACAHKGQKLNLTLREFDLLAYLLEHKNEVVKREELLQRVWGWDFDGGSRTVDVHIQQLRAKLDELASSIETLRGVGYILRDPGAQK